MQFIAKKSTSDGKLTIGKIYIGCVVMPDMHPGSLRIAVFCNRGEWQTFAPCVFVPYDKELFPELMINYE